MQKLRPVSFDSSEQLHALDLQRFTPDLHRNFMFILPTLQTFTINQDCRHCRLYDLQYPPVQSLRYVSQCQFELEMPKDSHLCCISSSATARGRRKRLKVPGTPWPIKLKHRSQSHMNSYESVQSLYRVCTESYESYAWSYSKTYEAMQKKPTDWRNWDVPSDRRFHRSLKNLPTLAPEKKDKADRLKYMAQFRPKSSWRSSETSVTTTSAPHGSTPRAGCSSGCQKTHKDLEPAFFALMWMVLLYVIFQQKYTHWHIERQPWAAFALPKHDFQMSIPNMFVECVLVNIFSMNTSKGTLKIVGQQWPAALPNTAARAAASGETWSSHNKSDWHCTCREDPARD